MAKQKTRWRGSGRLEEVRGLEAAEGSGGGEGWQRGGRRGGEEGRETAGEVATSPRKSRVMPTRNCTTPRAPLPTPSSHPVLLSHSPLPLSIASPARHPIRFSRFFHRPFVSLIPPASLSTASSHPRDPCRRVPRVWCAFSPASASHLTDLTHPRGITPLSAAPVVSAAPPVNLGETETIAAPTSTATKGALLDSENSLSLSLSLSFSLFLSLLCCLPFFRDSYRQDSTFPAFAGGQHLRKRPK